MNCPTIRLQTVESAYLALILILRSILTVCANPRHKQRHLYCLLRALHALRVIAFPAKLLKYSTMETIIEISRKHNDFDPLYFFTHNYYLSKKLTLSQRLNTALRHYQFERSNFNSIYIRDAYLLGGVTLWDHITPNNRFTIVLIATDDNLYEGELSVILSVNGVRLCRMSFCYVNTTLFRLQPQETLLISRNQTDQVPERTIFDSGFKHNAPHLFCLSAICGIAMANGFENVFGIAHDSQIAYHENYDTSFRNSYTALWEKFDAAECDDHVYRLNVPLKLRPVETVKRDHRRRARNRRQNWDDIAQSARSRMLTYRAAAAS
ncbi:DUF535 family protein [Methylocapsa palsarum]|uniref:Uncharacterized protein VirK/YbjX n=1 Tax=Methylocapsa palsarum TaxID=1612308 RepID=A0A1I3Y9B6_9HYPH|nr:DUF535 family protein [Methylocapsa palsarum]SFK28567.1 Uncharacterized protein VirK/YbjX [Methylocapsa palsarum]